MIRHLLNLIYPPGCPVCSVRLDKEQLCQNCSSSIKTVNPAVNRIRYPKNMAYYQRVYSAGLYDGALKEMIHLFKYKAKVSLAKVLSNLLIEFVQVHLNMDQFDLIVPVPLHSVRLREREFNQADLLARPLAGRFGIPFSKGVLRRLKAAPPQSGLKRDERLGNLKGVFCVRGGGSLKRKRILLIDDVFTTGATVNECAKTLLAAGAKSVSVLTLARGE